MKRTIAFLFILIFTCSLASTIPVNAQEDSQPTMSDEISQLTLQATKGNLDDANDINWYKITLEESGCAVVYFKSAHSRWNGYTYSWYLTVYDTDKKTVIYGTGAKGAPGEETLIPLGNVEAGEYYLKVSSTSSSNPLMSGFSTEPYEVSAFKVYHSTVIQYPESGFTTVSKAGEILYSYDQNYFVKLHDGEATAVLGRSKEGAIVPFLFSTEESAVEYLVMATGKIIRAGTNINKEHYYSDANYIKPYTNKYLTQEDLPLFLVRSIGYSGIEETLDEQEHQRKITEFKDFFKNNLTLFIIIGVIVAVLIIVGLIILGASKISYSPSKKSSKKNRPHYSSDSSYSNSSSYNYDDKSDEEKWREIDDMQMIQNMTERLNTPGYDPDSFGTYDPESFSSISDTESFGPPSDM